MPEALALDTVPHRACARCTRLCLASEIGRRSTLCRTCRSTCTSCKRVVGIEQLSRTARYCERCVDQGGGSVHVGPAFARGATVHPILPFAEDAAAQAFVEAHPDGATLEVCGDALGVTRERLRQIERKALLSLRKRCRLAGISAEDLASVLASRGRSTEHITPSTNMYEAAGYTRPSADAKAVLHPTLAEELYSPLGQRLTALLDRIELVAELVRRTHAHDDGIAPGPLPAELLVEHPDTTEEDDPMPKPRTITVNGTTRTLQEWAAELGVTDAAIRMRIKKGWTEEAAVTTPLGAASGKGSTRPPSKPKATPKPAPKASKAVPRPREVALKPASSAIDGLVLLEATGVAHELLGSVPRGRLVLLLATGASSS